MKKVEFSTRSREKGIKKFGMQELELIGMVNNKIKTIFVGKTKGIQLCLLQFQRGEENNHVTKISKFF